MQDYQHRPQQSHPLFRVHNGMRAWQRFERVDAAVEEVIDAIRDDVMGQAGFKQHEDGSVSIWATERMIRRLERYGA